MTILDTPPTYSRSRTRTRSQRAATLARVAAEPAPTWENYTPPKQTRTTAPAKPAPTPEAKPVQSVGPVPTTIPDDMRRGYGLTHARWGARVVVTNVFGDVLDDVTYPTIDRAVRAYNR